MRQKRSTHLQSMSGTYRAELDEKERVRTTSRDHCIRVVRNADGMIHDEILYEKNMGRIRGIDSLFHSISNDRYMNGS